MLKREAVRYLGYGRHAVDEQTSALIDRSFSDLQSVVNRKSIYRFFDLEWIDPEHVCDVTCGGVRKSFCLVQRSESAWIS